VWTGEGPGGWGAQWQTIVYRNIIDDSLSLALVCGTIDEAATQIVRMHHINPFDDILVTGRSETSPIHRAKATIAAAGSGAIVILGIDTWSEAIVPAADRSNERAFREYGVGAQILADLGIHQVIVLSNRAHHPVAIEGFGLSIVEERAF